MKRLLFLALLVLGPNAFGVQAIGFGAGNDLLPFCRESSSYCRGYMAATRDAHNVLAAWGNLDAKLFCTPKEVTPEQLRLVVFKYLEARPTSEVVSAISTPTRPRNSNTPSIAMR